MQLTRRACTLGAAAGLVSSAAWAEDPSLRKHAAFRIWRAPRKPIKAPLSAEVTDLAGRKLTLGQWMNGQAAIVIYWATWCTPCLAETPELNRLQQQLKASGAKTSVRPVHAYDDDADLAKARAVFNRLGARELETVQASPALERAGLRIFGKSPVEPQRTSLPALMLVAADGSIVATRIGTPDPERGQPAYWSDPRTLDMLTRLGRLS